MFPALRMGTYPQKVFKVTSLSFNTILSNISSKEVVSL